MTTQAGSSRLLREINESAALSLLLERGPLTRGDLRDLTGLAKPTTSDVMRRLQEAGLVRVIGRTSGGPGPNADIYDVNPDAAYAAAASLQEKDSSLITAVCDLTGEVRSRVTTKLSDDPVKSVAEGVQLACQKARIPRKRLDHVQLGVPGAHHDGTIRYVDVPGWSRPGLIDDIRARLRTPVSVDNDVNLAAAAERSRGIAGNAESFALLWLGEEGLGLGIDLGGTVLRGARGGAGEIGYMPVGVPQHDGAHDFQEFVGGPAILALAREHGIEVERAEDAVRSAAATLTEPDTSDPFLSALAVRIATGIAAVVAVLDPALVVLAGEVGQAGGPVLAGAVGAALRDLSVLETEVAATGLTEDAVLLGALDTTLTAVRTALLDRR
ncbi:ROK family transcriptional regulator [Actinophytocola sp.]|uniref:ROK family transcriptional regulator n=1 Tax=Actinophytocola sp. TaxID=1872138 RepID=UPI002ED2E637